MRNRFQKTDAVSIKAKILRIIRIKPFMQAFVFEKLPIQAIVDLHNVNFMLISVKTISIGNITVFFDNM